MVAAGIGTVFEARNWGGRIVGSTLLLAFGATMLVGLMRRPFALQDGNTMILFATILFALKAGLSLGGAIGGWLLSGYGYRANVAQTAHAILGIRLSASVVSIDICSVTLQRPALSPWMYQWGTTTTL